MMLQVLEIFESIQGESSFSGLPFTFIRLAGCNLECAWCDTNMNRPAREMDIDTILGRVRSGGLRHVCITGGEPLLQSGCIPLMQCLVDAGFIVTLETNGSIDITRVPLGVHRIVDIKCPSSGMAERNRIENLRHLHATDEVKFVIMNRTDYTYARDVYLNRLKGFSGCIHASPVTGKLEPSRLASWILSDKIPFRVHLQIHKILNLP